MKIFVAASYSSQVNYETGKVNSEYKNWLESELISLEEQGYQVFCALRADGYIINDVDPAKAFHLDIDQIKSSDILLAYVTDNPSAGVQTEIGYALALGKKVVIAHEEGHKLAYFNQAMLMANQVREITYPVANKI